MSKIKIFNYVWHVSHQAELFRIPNTEWSWLLQHRRQFGEAPRGDLISKYGVKLVPHYEKGLYDFALLHLDQQCFEDSLWERGKGSLFREVNDVVKDIPKIVIMHGTPYYPESFDCDITEDNYKEFGFIKDQIGMSSKLINKFKEVTKEMAGIVFNSHTAKKQWGFENDLRAITIWHGMEKEDWLDLPKEPRVVTMISPAGLDRYYDRIFLRGIKEALQERDIEHCHITVDASFRNFEEYRNFLGRSLIYINPTRESPMPRSRTEAMFSGCCVLTTPHQDANTFIENGVNGILIPRNPQVVADLVEGLIYDYKQAINLGQKGKQTAIEKFSGERFRQNWLDFISKVIKK